MVRKYPISPRSLTTPPTNDIQPEDTVDGPVTESTEKVIQDLTKEEEVIEEVVEEKTVETVVETPKVEVKVEKLSPKPIPTPVQKNPPPNLPSVTRPRRNISRFSR
jgi:hypothetical protein